MADQSWKRMLRQLKRDWRRQRRAEELEREHLIALREAAGEYLAQSPARGLLNLAKKSGYHKGEVVPTSVGITPRQFRAIFGYGPKSSVLNSQGKVPWEYCFDQVVPTSVGKKGVQADEELKREIEYALRLRRSPSREGRSYG